MERAEGRERVGTHPLERQERGTDTDKARARQTTLTRGVAVQEGDAGQALAVLERVHHQRLLGREHALRHLVGLERVRVLQLLAACLLTHLPLQV